MHWLAHFLGLDSASGAFYLAWSGFVGDLGFLGAFAVLLRHLNCHTPGCRGIGHFPLEGSPYKVCRKCRGTVTAEHIRRAIKGPS
jgi:hypothetical protein